MMTFALAGVCGLLLLMVLLQFAGFGRGYSWLPQLQPDTAQIAGNVERETFAMPPASSFSELQTRPLFNADRKPTPLDASAALETEAPPPVALNVTLTGVIDTPEVKIAMLRDNARNQTMSLKVGMPLEGEQAGWTLFSISPRKAIFTNANNEEAEVELETAAGPIAAAQPPRRPVAPGKIPPKATAIAPAAEADSDSSSDLAKRIEERRRQMREEAEKLRSERRGNTPTNQPKTE
ncbi:MAG: hypothetical protein ABIY56_03325 [Dokdonella sp.]